MIFQISELFSTIYIIYKRQKLLFKSKDSIDRWTIRNKNIAMTCTSVSSEMTVLSRSGPRISAPLARVYCLTSFVPYLLPRCLCSRAPFIAFLHSIIYVSNIELSKESRKTQKKKTNFRFCARVASSRLVENVMRLRKLRTQYCVYYLLLPVPSHHNHT